MNPEKRSILPYSAFTSFSSRFCEPRLEEGFQDITVVHFEVISGISRSHEKISDQKS